MPNTNCLKGFKCPKCGYKKEFRILGTAIFTVTDDGTEDYDDVEWDGESGCTCPDCWHHGTVVDFTRPRKKAGVPTKPKKKR